MFLPQFAENESTITGGDGYLTAAVDPAPDARHNYVNESLTKSATK